MRAARDIVVRPARLADALAMASVHHAAVHGLAASWYPAEVLERWAPPVTLHRAERVYHETQDEGGLHLVAEAAGEIVGFGVVVPETGEIAACYVAPGIVRRGIGQLLLAALERRAAQSGVHELAVRASVNARSFYAANGYRVAGHGEHRFGDGTGMDVLHMRKDNSPLG